MSLTPRRAGGGGETFLSGGAAAFREFYGDSNDRSDVQIRDRTSSPAATWTRDVDETMCVTATPLTATKIVKDNNVRQTRTTTTIITNPIAPTTVAATPAVSPAADAQATRVQGSHGTSNDAVAEANRPQHTSIM